MKPTQKRLPLYINYHGKGIKNLNTAVLSGLGFHWLGDIEKFLVSVLRNTLANQTVLEILRSNLSWSE